MGNVSLAGWQLTLPVGDPDDADKADSVDPAQLSPPWLTEADGGGVVIFAPVHGAPPANSDHPRTELVNKDTFSAGGGGTHTLTATVSVTQLPQEQPDVILGQIHGAKDIKSVPWVMLHYFDGAIKVVVKQAQTGSKSQNYSLADDVPLGTPFTFHLTDNGTGQLTFAVDVDGHTTTVDAPVPAAFSGATVRFQTGAYQQGESKTATAAAADDGARVTFTAITTS